MRQVLAALLGLGVAGSAQAGLFTQLLKDENKQPLEHFCDPTLIGDTVPYAVGAEARRSFAKTYGAVSQLERDVLPGLEARDDDASLVRIGMDSMFNVTRLPSTACGELALQKFDTSAYNFGAGVRAGRLRLFYSASANSSIIWKAWPDRVLKHGGTFLLGHFYSLTAPLWGSRSYSADQLDDNVLTEDYAFIGSGDKLGGAVVDYVAGASFDAEVAIVGAGYVGSQGVYVRAQQPHTKVFVDSIADLRSESVDPLRYLKAGLAGFDWLDEDVADTIGHLDANYARYRLIGPTGNLYQATGELREPEESTQALSTVRQRDILEWVDVGASAVVQPEPAFYDGSVTVHNPGFHQDVSNEYEGGIAGTIGVVNLPDRYYFGVRGGLKPHVALRVEGPIDNSDRDRSKVRFEVLVNDPETLTFFPYAQGAWRWHLSATFGSD